MRATLAAQKKALNFFGEVKWSKITVNYHRKYIDLMNRSDYIFSDAKDDVDELASYLKVNEADSVKSVHFFFPSDVDAAPQISTHIVVNISGFSDGFRVFETGCAQSH